MPALKEKRGPVTTYRPPHDVLGMGTTARRVWLRACVEALEAAPLPAGAVRREVKIVGQGSYQTVREVLVTAVEGRVRLRGTCQACGGRQVVDGGHIVLHGYQRPGWGQIHGRCAGVQAPPAEVSVALTRMLIAQMRDAVAQHKAEAARYEARAETTGSPTAADRFDAPRPVLHPTDRRKGYVAAVTWLREGFVGRGRHHMDQAWHAQNYADDLRTLVLPRLGQPLFEEVVA